MDGIDAPHFAPKIGSLHPMMQWVARAVNPCGGGGAAIGEVAREIAHCRARRAREARAVEAGGMGKVT
jgi:hypothetical protein